MKLVKIGDIIINMDQVLAIQDNEDHLTIFFSVPTAEYVLSIKLEDENCNLMRLWLNRNGINNLSTESPVFNWNYYP